MGHGSYSKPRVNDFSYTAESSSCLYRNKSSSWPKSTLASGGLPTEVISETLLADIIGEESVMTLEDDLFIRAAMPAGLMRRRRGEKSAKPDVNGMIEAMIAKVKQLKSRRLIVAGAASCLSCK